MTALTWFASDPDVGLPAIVELPSNGLRHAAVAAAGTNRVLWVRVGDRVGRLNAPGPWTLEPVRNGLRCWSASADVLVSDAVSVNLDPRIRRGLDTTARREPGGPWEIDVPLPGGARWARDLRPLAEGRGVTWSDSGWRYRWTFEGAPVVLGRKLGQESDPAIEPAIPEDATLGRTKVGGLRVVATRLEDGLVRGWLRDGAVVVDRV